MIRKQANEDLALRFDWLCANKLSLNSRKTEFIIFHGRRAKNVRITLTINKTNLFESKKMKYLGLIVYSNWTSVRSFVGPPFIVSPKICS